MSTRQPKNPIYLWVKNNGIPVYIGKLDRRIAQYMSEKIKTRVQNGGAKEVGDKEAVGFEDIDVTAARQILKWVNKFDTYGDYGPQALTQVHAESSTLSAIVNLHAAAHDMGFPRKMRGDVLHNDMVHHFHRVPLTAAEFVKVNERAAFDHGLISALINSTANFKLSDHPPAEMAKIEAYCKEKDLIQALRDAESRIRNSPQHQAARAQQVGQVSQTPPPNPAPTTVAAGGVSYASLFKRK